ncbi:50S ribosome-binding GTPase [Candidatus Pacearchaeota archaeon]|nr:50S ribosome-binding GTPase [Candidatus Pacearchaeota archaeon]
MASTNQSPFYQRAEKNFLEAENPEDKIRFLEEMIKECPKHKSSENMLANLRTRYKKLTSQLEKAKKSGKSSKAGIKKEDLQAVLIGKSNSGKSTLLTLLTNASPRISDTKFTTTHPVIGMMNYEGANIQLIEIPGIESEYYDKGLANTADTILIVITKLDQLKQIEEKIEKSYGKRIIIFNKSDILTENEKRKISATLQSKKYNFVMSSSISKQDFNDLKSKLLQSFGKIRVYTKEPKKEKSKRPIILEPNSTVRDLAKNLHKNFIEKFKFAKVWGPSSKFAGMTCGLKHVLKDKDIIELHTS